MWKSFFCTILILENVSYKIFFKNFNILLLLIWPLICSFKNIYFCVITRGKVIQLIRTHPLFSHIFSYMGCSNWKWSIRAAQIHAHFLYLFTTYIDLLDITLGLWTNFGVLNHCAPPPSLAVRRFTLGLVPNPVAGVKRAIRR